MRRPVGAIVLGLSACGYPLALPLWVFGLAWAELGWQRYVEPLWVTIPSGVILALIAPSFAAGHYGWMYAIGIATAAAAMAASVPLRNVPLLALGALAMFGYVTSVAARYLHQSLRVPSALAIIGVLIIGLAVVSARLMRAAHPPDLRRSPPSRARKSHRARHLRRSPPSRARKSHRARHLRRSPPSRARKIHHTPTLVIDVHAGADRRLRRGQVRGRASRGWLGALVTNAGCRCPRRRRVGYQRPGAPSGGG